MQSPLFALRFLFSISGFGFAIGVTTDLDSRDPSDRPSKAKARRIRPINED